MQTVAFAGRAYTGSVELDRFGITLFATPSDPDADPHIVSIALDPTPEEADAIAAAVINWASAVRERRFAAAQMEFLGLLS